MIRQVFYGNHYFLPEFGEASAEFMLPDCSGFPPRCPGCWATAGSRASRRRSEWGSAVGIPFNVGIWVGPDGSPLPGGVQPGQLHEHDSK